MVKLIKSDTVLIISFDVYVGMCFNLEELVNQNFEMKLQFRGSYLTRSCARFLDNKCLTSLQSVTRGKWNYQVHTSHQNINIWNSSASFS